MKYLLAFLIVLSGIESYAQKKFTVSGYFTDDKSSETLIGATVYDNLSKHGAISNVFGFYSITLSEGSHSLQYSYVGYTPEVVDFVLTKDTVINVKLKESTALGEVVVTAEKNETVFHHLKWVVWIYR